jgi:hypothetical protein
MKRSIHIEAPVETVFDSFKEPAKFMDLAPVSTQVDEVKVTKEGVGTYMSWHTRIAGLPMRGFDVLTDVIPNKHITERSSNPLVGTWLYDFEPEGSGTKVTMEHNPESFWRIRPLRNLVELAVDRMSDSYMPRVKDALESKGH